MDAFRENAKQATGEVKREERTLPGVIVLAQNKASRRSATNSGMVTERYSQTL